MSLAHLQVLLLVFAAWALGVTQARHEETEETSGGQFLDFETARLMRQSAEDVLSWKALPVIVSPMVAVVGFFVKAIVEARTNARRLQLERVQLQIQEFYGPISALSHRGKTAFNSMLDVYSRYWQDHIRADPNLDLKEKFMSELRSAQNNPTDDPTRNPAVMLWVHFIKSIAYPVNSRIVQLLTDKSHLHDGPLPDDYLDLFGLVAERELVIAQWDRGDYGQLLFKRRFPTEFDSIIEERLQELQELQVTLGGAKTTQRGKHGDRARSLAVERSQSEKYTLTQPRDDGSDGEPVGKLTSLLH